MNNIKNKKGLKKILNLSLSKANFYELAISVHKTHRNKKLKIKNTFLESIYKDTNRNIVIMKSTQSGISEFLVIRAIARAIKGANIFYVLPTYELKNQFVKERFDKTIIHTKYYRSLLRSGEKKLMNSTSIKMIGPGTIAFVGSNSSTAFTSFPADDAIIDEWDECNQDNLIMVPERQSHSDDKYTLSVGNPKISKTGIHANFLESDQKYWCIKCDCGEWIFPDFFKHIVDKVDENVFIIKDKLYDPLNNKDIRLICHKCGKAFDRNSPGLWVNKIKHNDSGYQISKIFSTYTTVRELVDRFDKGLYNESKMQRFYNGDLGLPYVAKGAKIDNDMLDECIDDYLMSSNIEYRCVMGIDVGSVLNVVIRQILPSGKMKAQYIGVVRELNEICELYKKYKVVCAVIDGLPETRLSKKFAFKFKGSFMCFFGSEKEDRVNPEKKTVTVERTQMLDTVKEFIMTRVIINPKNAGSIDGYYEQMKASTRLYNEKKGKYVWDEGNNPDHYFLAEGYCNIAKRILMIATK